MDVQLPNKLLLIKACLLPLSSSTPLSRSSTLSPQNPYLSNWPTPTLYLNLPYTSLVPKQNSNLKTQRSQAMAAMADRVIKNSAIRARTSTASPPARPFQCQWHQGCPKVSYNHFPALQSILTRLAAPPELQSQIRPPTALSHPHQRKTIRMRL